MPHAAVKLDRAFEQVWAKALEKHLQGLDLKDPDDRATFRGQVERAFKDAKVSAIREVAQALGAKPKNNSRPAMARAVADAYIAGKRLKKAATAERVADRFASTKIDGILRRIKKIPRIQVESEEKLSGKGNLMWTVYTAKLPGSDVTLTFKDNGKGVVRTDFKVKPGKGNAEFHKTLKDALEDFRGWTED